MLAGVGRAGDYAGDPLAFISAEESRWYDVGEVQTTSTWGISVPGGDEVLFYQNGSIQATDPSQPHVVTAAVAGTFDKFAVVPRASVFVGELPAYDPLGGELLANLTTILPYTADRYFVGDTDDDWNDANNWAFSSGAAGGAGVPASTNPAYLDASSPACTLDVNAECFDIDLTGYTGTFVGTGFDLDVYRDVVVVSGATWTPPDLIALKGSAAQSVTFGTQTFASLEVGATNSPTVSFQDTADFSGSILLKKGTLDFNDQAVTVSGTLSADNTGTTTLNSGSGTITLKGNVALTNLDTFNHENGKWVFAKTSGTQEITCGGATFYDIDFDGAAGATTTYELQDTYSADGTTTLRQGTLDFNDQAVSLNGAFVVANDGETILNSGTGTVTAKGDVVFTNLDTFTHEAGKWVFDQTSGVQSITNNGKQFFNVDFDGAAATSVTYQMQDTYRASGNTILRQGELDFNDQNSTMTGSFLVSNTASTKVLSGSGTIECSGTDVSMTALDEFEAEGGTWKFSRAAGMQIKVENQVFANTIFAVIGLARLWNSGNGTLGAVLHQTGTIEVQNGNYGLDTYTNDNTGTTQIDSGTGTITATGDVDFTNLDTFNHDNGKWVFAKTSGEQQVQIPAGGMTFYNADFDGAAAGTVTYKIMGATPTFAGNVYLNQGTLDFNDQDILFEGSFIIGLTATTEILSGTGTVTCKGDVWLNNLNTFTHESGTWVIGGTTAQTCNLNSKTFNILNITNTSDVVTLGEGFTAASNTISAGASVTFGSTKTFTLNDITWDGSEGNLITLRSTTPGIQWNLVTAAEEVVTFVDAQDSNSTLKIDATSDCVDSGNNTNWDFGVGDFSKAGMGAFYGSWIGASGQA